jgi:hypothetical protein
MDRVRINSNRPDLGLKKGDSGTIFKRYPKSDDTIYVVGFTKNEIIANIKESNLSLWMPKVRTLSTAKSIGAFSGLLFGGGSVLVPSLALILHMCPPSRFLAAGCVYSLMGAAVTSVGPALGGAYAGIRLAEDFYPES